MTLHKKMAHGAFWSLLEKGGQQGLSFVVFMVLARLVGPEEYGLANICFIYFSLTTMIVYGLVDGVVSLQIEDDAHLSSLFWSILGLGALLSLFCAGTAGLMANFMDQPRLKYILYCFSVAPLLVSLSSVPNALILKSMDFKVYTIRTLAATSAGGAVGLAMAFKGWGAYAIVGQQIVLFIVTNLVLWFSSKWRPRLFCCTARFKEAVLPGINMLYLSLVGFFDEQTPRFVIGRVLGPTALGFYAFTLRLLYALIETLISPPMTVLYPAFAAIRNDKAEQQKIAGNILFLCYFLFTPAFAVAIGCAPLYVPLIFGPAWGKAVPLLQIYLFSGVSWPLGITVRQLFRAHNKLGQIIRIKLCLSFVLLLSVSLLWFPNGLVLMGSFVTALAFLMQPVYLLVLKRAIQIDLRENIFNLWPFALSGLFSFGSICWFMGSSWAPSALWTKLFVSTVVGLAAYLISVFLLAFPDIKKIFSFTLSIIRSSKISPAFPNESKRING